MWPDWSGYARRSAVFMASIQPSLLGLEKWEQGIVNIILRYFEWMISIWTCIAPGKSSFEGWYAMICVWVHTWHTDGFFPQTVFPHWGVLTVGVKAGAWSLTLGRGILPVNFRTKWLLWNLDMRFDCAGSHKVFVCVLGSFWSAAFYL